MRPWLRATSGGVAGAIVGAIVTLAVQSAGSSVPDERRASPPIGPGTSPTTFLAWVPRGLPTGFADAVEELGGIEASTVVAEDIAWLEASWSAAGERVDDPPPRFRIPIDVAAVDAAAYRRFVPAADRPAVAAVDDGQAVLSATSAALRELGPGAMLAFAGDVRVRVAAVLPDHLVGAAEMLVDRDVGRALGVRHERYALVRPVDPDASTGVVKAMLRPLLPSSLGVNRRIQVRAPGDTPYFRAGDAVLPLVVVKALFGEFAARPNPRARGGLIVDPTWLHANIRRTELPAIDGTVTCHRAILPQLEGALRELVDRGLAERLRSYHGCFVPRHIGGDPRNLLSYHSWGIALDVNLAGNVRGQAPRQPPALVRTLERWGFTWGGSWLVPDGSHFEFHRLPAS